MDVGGVTFALAIATFLLAGAAAWSIWQNRCIIQSDRKIKLLDEVKDWAIDAFSAIKVVSPATWDNNLDWGKSSLIEAGDIITRLEPINKRGQYILHITKIIDKDLEAAAIKLKNAIEGRLMLVQKSKTYKAPPKANELKIVLDLFSDKTDIRSIDFRKLSDQSKNAIAFGLNADKIREKSDELIEIAIKIKSKYIF